MHIKLIGHAIFFFLISLLPLICGARTYTTIYPAEEFEPETDGKLFRNLDKCSTKCLVRCQKFLIDEDDETLFVCKKIKPIEKTLPEKLFSTAPVPLILSAIILCVITIFVCTCIAWGVCGCCRKRTTRRNDNSSREPLQGEGGRLEEIFAEEHHVHMDQEKHRTGSKYLSEV